jgi:hypothetical protein
MLLCPHGILLSPPPPTHNFVLRRTLVGGGRCSPPLPF